MRGPLLLALICGTAMAWKAGKPPGRTRRASTVQSEFGLIRKLRPRAAQPDPQVFKGIGDDTAIPQTSSTEWTLTSTDLLWRGFAFRSYNLLSGISATAPPSQSQRYRRNGGTPRFMLVSVRSRPPARRRQIQQLYRGMTGRCPYRVRLSAVNVCLRQDCFSTSRSPVCQTTPGATVQQRTHRRPDFCVCRNTGRLLLA